MKAQASEAVRIGASSLCSIRCVVVDVGVPLGLAVVLFIGFLSILGVLRC